MYRQNYAKTELCTDRTMYRENYVQTKLCTYRTMYRRKCKQFVRQNTYRDWTFIFMTSSDFGIHCENF